LPEAADTSNPGGAVAVTADVKLLPDTVNCWILGLADAVPAQAVMVPVALPALIADCAKAYEANEKKKATKAAASKALLM